MRPISRPCRWRTAASGSARRSALPAELRPVCSLVDVWAIHRTSCGDYGGFSPPGARIIAAKHAANKGLFRRKADETGVRLRRLPIHDERVACAGRWGLQPVAEARRRRRRTHGRWRRHCGAHQDALALNVAGMDRDVEPHQVAVRIGGVQPVVRAALPHRLQVAVAGHLERIEHDVGPHHAVSRRRLGRQPRPRAAAHNNRAARSTMIGAP